MYALGPWGVWEPHARVTTVTRLLAGDRTDYSNRTVILFLHDQEQYYHLYVTACFNCLNHLVSMVSRLVGF